MINKASNLYGLTVKIIRTEARYGLGVGGGWFGGGRNNDEKRK